MDRNFRTLIFRIFNGRTSNVAKVLKKPYHYKSIEKFAFDALVKEYGITKLDADIFCGPDGNYLHLGFCSDDCDGLAAAILGKKNQFGIWLNNNAKFPKGAGYLAYQAGEWQGQNLSSHLWQIDEPSTFLESFDFDALGSLDRIVPIEGIRAHYHVRGSDVLLHLGLTTKGATDWLEIQRALQSGVENESLIWLASNATPQASTPIRKVLRFSL